ncbi:CU044_5270 family protein [Streptomyces atratus]|uniref:CU044_5270 family protein n=1 Tax=Streptomyces atratus TaxID=1893 RepID=UPI002AC351AA|nr:CU044_5270 family protein [Streptomyces atratus]WPW29872.1 CU044_5270 family protein [Streptomyces atratus]
MTANPSRQSPAEWEESAQLLPLTTRELPSGRHQFHKERLMARIQQEERTATAAAAEPKARRFTMPRRAFAVPAMACALAGAVFVGASVFTSDGEGTGAADGSVLTTSVGAATTKGVPQLLDQISLAAAEVPDPKAGQYVYIESKTANSYEKVVAGGSSLAIDKLHRRQIWMSLDGTKGWLIDPAVNESPEGETLSLPDEQGNVPVATLNGPSYDYLAKLTTDPDKLLQKIYKETEGQGNSPDQEAFETIGDLLGESYPPARLYSALFKTAAKIPGVVVVEDAVDAAGRHGVAVARLDETSGERVEWIFDKKTHVFLGERSVQVREDGGDSGVIKRGTVTNTSAIMKRAIVDDIKQTPTEGG